MFYVISSLSSFGIFKRGIGFDKAKESFLMTKLLRGVIPHDKTPLKEFIMRNEII